MNKIILALICSFGVGFFIGKNAGENTETLKVRKAAIKAINEAREELRDLKNTPNMVVNIRKLN